MTRLIVAHRKAPSSDVLSLFEGHLARLKDEQQALLTHLHNHKDDFPGWVWHEWETLVLALEDAVLPVECETEDCPHMATVIRRWGRCCEACNLKWTRCQGCGGDVLVAEAVTDDEGREHHESCVGPDDQAAYESAAGL